MVRVSWLAHLDLVLWHSYRTRAPLIVSISPCFSKIVSLRLCMTRLNSLHCRHLEAQVQNPLSAKIVAATLVVLIIPHR
jgi:hypothetical protein